MGGSDIEAFGRQDSRMEKLDSFIDMTTQWGVLALGYGHPVIREAVRGPLEAGLVHACGHNFNHVHQVNLAEALVKRMPPDFEWQVDFYNTGAEAVEHAMKLARHCKKKPTFLALEGAFHGRTIAAMSLGTAGVLSRGAFGDFGVPVRHVSFNHPEQLRALEEMTTPAKDDICAVFVEPIQGVGGCKVVPVSFMRELREFCDRNNALMVVDEVQSGCGRSGKFWAFEYSGIVPDVVCAAKALGGGLPLSAVITKKEFCTMSPGNDGSTFGGNPMACAGGVALLEFIDDDMLKEIAANGWWFRTNLQRHLSRINTPFEWRWQVEGLGLMLAINMPNREFRKRVIENAFQQKMLVATAEPAAIRLLPPLNVNQSVLSASIDILYRSVDRAVIR